MIIDVHAHVGPAFAYRPTIQPGATGEDVVRIMDRSGIDKVCLFAAAWQGPEFVDPEYDQANRAVYEAQRQYPDRLLGFCRVEPNRLGRAVDEMRRCREEYGFYGLKLHPMSDHFQPNNLRLMAPIMEKCAEYRWPIYSHAGYYPTCEPALFIPLAQRFPEVNVVVGHLGYAHTSDCVIAANLYPNIYLEPAGNSTPIAIREVLEKVSHRQFVFGSDLPFTYPEDVMDKIVSQPGLSEESRNLILGGNMARLLGFDQS